MIHLPNEHVIRAIDLAPVPVRKMVQDGRIAKLAVELGNSYQLHIDVIGVLAELMRNLAIGLIHPTDFMHELTAAGVEEGTIRQIINDVNEKMFKPLQEEMRKNPGGGQSGGGVATPAPTVVPQPPPPRPASPPPPPRPAPSSAPRPTPAPPMAKPVLPLPRVPAPTPPPKAPVQGGAPLPPRTVLPGASAPVFHHPMPPPTATERTPMSRPSTSPPSGWSPGLPLERESALPPANLPTGLVPGGVAAGPEDSRGTPAPPEPEFNTLPRLTRPTSPPASPSPPGDPYHEPIDEPPA